MNYKIFKTDLKPWLKKFFFDKFSYIIKTITGTIIIISDGIRKKVNELKMSKESTQETTTGKNLFDTRKTAITSNGVTFTPNNNGSITIKGTSTAALNVTLVNTSNPPVLTAGTYRKSIKVVGTITKNNNYCFLTGRDNNNNNVLGDTDVNSNMTNSNKATLEEEHRMTSIGIWTNAGNIVFDCTVYIQIEVGENATEWEKYTNGPSPNPDYPQEIKTVTGYKNLYYMNYNDYPGNYGNVSVVWKKSGYSAVGTSTVDVGLTLTGRRMTLPAGTYTMLLKNKTTLSQVGLSKTNFSAVVRISKGNNRGTFTLTEETEVCLTLIIVNGETYNDDNEIMIIKGIVEELPFVPYGTNYVYTKVTGKNLFNKDSVVNGYLNVNGTISSNNSYRVSDYIYVGNLEKITISGNAGGNEVYCFYNEDKTFNSANSMGTNTSKTINIPSNAKYIRCTVDSNNLNQYQIEFGEVISLYEPYKESIVTIPLNDNEIAGIGDYKDELIVDKNGHCWLNKKLKKITLNGAENYVYYPNERWNIRLILSDMKAATNTVWRMSTGIMSTHFKKYYWGDGSVNANGKMTTLNTYKWVSFGMTSITTLNEWKQWAEENKPDVIYPLEEEQLIDLNYTVDIRLFKGTNNISNSEDMDMILKYYSK